jgi:hypothetical protein
MIFTRCGMKGRDHATNHARCAKTSTAAHSKMHKCRSMCTAQITHSSLLITHKILRRVRSLEVPQGAVMVVAGRDGGSSRGRPPRLSQEHPQRAALDPQRSIDQSLAPPQSMPLSSHRSPSTRQLQGQDWRVHDNAMAATQGLDPAGLPTSACSPPQHRSTTTRSCQPQPWLRASSCTTRRAGDTCSKCPQQNEEGSEAAPRTPRQCCIGTERSSQQPSRPWCIQTAGAAAAAAAEDATAAACDLTATPSSSHQSNPTLIADSSPALQQPQVWRGLGRESTPELKWGPTTGSAQFQGLPLPRHGVRSQGSSSPSCTCSLTTPRRAKGAVVGSCPCARPLGQRSSSAGEGGGGAPLAAPAPRPCSLLGPLAPMQHPPRGGEHAQSIAAGSTSVAVKVARDGQASESNKVAAAGQRPPHAAATAAPSCALHPSHVCISGALLSCSGCPPGATQQGDPTLACRLRARTHPSYGVPCGTARPAQQR